ncbi:DUF6118 family protein [Sphingobium sp. Sx8-8]|uniref:DUF6118 family protein n=1 Tax=Sphingobium sp. Sx8-8 TaxID=2933617 RepID=UPI001F56DC13|nr:DUF6118 family protein [Sphingobium sp. Sx8-8]
MDDGQSLLSETEPQEETAAQAFARLDGRIALLSRAIEHLAAERSNIDIPDYSATLGQMNARLAAIAQALAGISGKPAMQWTPEEMSARMDAAAEKSRRADAVTLKEAREVHLEAAKAIRAFIPIAHEGREQRKHLLWAANGGLLAGCLLWAILPGVILRALPTGWHMPESMAAHIIGESALWDAGARMMRAGDPQAWRTLTAAVEIWRDNRNLLDACTRKADKSEQPVPCNIRVRNGMDGQSSTGRR